MWTTIEPVQPAFRWIASTGLVRMLTFTTVPACGPVQTQRLSTLLMIWSGGATVGVTSSARCWPRAGLAGLAVFAGRGLRLESVWATAVVAVAARAATASVRARGERFKGT